MGRFKHWAWLASLLILVEGEAHAAFDPAILQRGAHLAVEVCNSCHSLKYIKYGDFQKIGMTKLQVDAMRGDKGLGDPIIAQMAPNDALTLFGTIPPDLSLMANAREGGAQYISELLTGFYTDASGATNNHVVPGIKMPDILGVSQADPASRKEAENKANDVSAFLEWAADPQAEARKRTGYGVLIYVFVLTILFYLLKNKIWTKLKKSDHPS